MERGIRYRVSGRSLRSRWSFALALGAGFALSFALPAQAATETLDQSQPLNGGLESVGQMAQTFTAGITGQLDRVSLSSDAGFAAGTVSIQTVSGTFPAGTVLGTNSYSVSYLCCHGFHDFGFTPAVPVTAGAHYAIVVKVPRGKFTWYDSNGVDAYAGGQLYLGCNGCAWGTDKLHGGDYAFKTWVIGGSANQAPTVAADNANVTVNEGTAAANTGTFSDPDGDTVAITASAGTVTPTGTSAGTWSWTQPASDEPSSQTVTVKADDGHGLSASATFAATTIGVAPTVTISRATTGLSASALSTTEPASTPEGTAVNLNGSVSSPSAEDNAAGFTYSWIVTKNGTAFGTGSAAAFSFTPDDEGTFVATLQATDDGGMTGTTSVTFTGANVAPSAKIAGFTASAPLVITAHESLTFGGSFSDPGALDSHTATWNFGDGSISTTSFGPGGSAGLSVTHSYGAAGNYTVNLTVTDDDGGVGQATTKVTVQTVQQALSSISAAVQGLTSLNAGQRNSLNAKIDAANASAARGNTTAANNQLNAFLNEVQADVNSGRISSGAAANLRGAVHAVQAALGTYNRFLQWWPLGA
jgi:hypothetical protein